MEKYLKRKIASIASLVISFVMILSLIPANTMLVQAEGDNNNPSGKIKFNISQSDLGVTSYSLNGIDYQVVTNGTYVSIAENQTVYFKLTPNAGYQVDTARGVTLRCDGTGVSLNQATGIYSYTFTGDVTTHQYEFEAGFENSQGGGNQPAQPANRKDITINFWTNDNGTYKKISSGLAFILNDVEYGEDDQKTPNFESFVQGNYTITGGGNVSGTNRLYLAAGLEKYIDEAYVLAASSFDGSGNLSNPTADGNAFLLNQTYEWVNQSGQVEREMPGCWNVELPINVSDTKSTYNIYVSLKEARTVVWSDDEIYGPDALLEHGRAQLVDIRDSNGNDLLAQGKAGATVVSKDAQGNRMNYYGPDACGLPNGINGYLTIPVGAKVTLKLIPDYGYQIGSAVVNENLTLQPNTDVSSFTFTMPATNVHFKGIFKKTDNATDVTGSENVKQAQIAGQGLALSGNMNLTVKDDENYAKKDEALQMVSTANGQEKTALASLNLTIDNVVSKGTADASGKTQYWTTNVTDLQGNDAKISLELNGLDISGQDEVAVVREHDGNLDSISNVTYDSSTGTLSFESDLFSTYTIVKVSGTSSTEEDSQAMYRLYNPNSGEHFYTAVSAEREHLIAVGWKDEGIAWYAPKTGDPVYRLYNPNAGDHHYTMNKEEKDYLIRMGWNYEGISWRSGGNVPLYRAYNPNAVSGAHHYTTSKAEIDYIVNAGWKDENIGWYGVK